MRRYFLARIIPLTVSSILGFTLSVGSGLVDGEADKVTVKPDTVYIERSETGQHLNFDFLFENRTDRELLLTGVELSAFDDRGRLGRRDFVNRFSRVSLELTSRRAVGPKQAILVFNPFHSFAASVPLKKLRYEFAFATEDGKLRYKSVAEVAPILYETKTALVLPMKGRVLVWDGHDYNSHHRRFDYTLPVFQRRGLTANFMRYGYDFVKGIEGLPSYFSGFHRAAGTKTGPVGRGQVGTGDVLENP
jgi:hypothetical protein